MSIASVGIDIAKFTFHLGALDLHGKVVVRKKFSPQNPPTIENGAASLHILRVPIAR